MADVITGAIISTIVGGAFDRAERAWTAYQNKEISKEQYEAEKEKARMEASTSMFDSFQKSLRKSKILQVAYVTSLFLSMWVLFWFAWIQPCAVAWVEGEFPACKTGDLILSWHYWLLAGQLGLGPFIMGKR